MTWRSEDHRGGWRVVREYPSPDDIHDFLAMQEEDEAFEAGLMADERGLSGAGEGSIEGGIGLSPALPEVGLVETPSDLDSRLTRDTPSVATSEGAAVPNPVEFCCADDDATGIQGEAA